jgi:uncharacterized protein YpuA (DUF1002 family)
MKKLIAIVLTVCLLSGAVSASGLGAGDARVVIGADLTDAQITSVYQTFGLERGKATELTVSNDEERQYLNGLVDESLIGTRSISCVYVEILPGGDGLQAEVSNISWCTREMYINALVTAGVDDAKLIVTSPVSGISGTAALTGVYKAYEDMSGEKLDELAKLAGTQELVITSELADEIGNYDAVTIVNELKLILSETKNMTDAELREKIDLIAKDYNVTVSDSQKDQLVKLCRSLEGLGTDELKAKVEQAQAAIKKMAKAQETATGILRNVKDFATAVAEFFTNLWNRLKGK